LAATNAASPSNFRNIPETCATCHARREGAAGDLAHRRGSISNYQHSVHARILHDEGRHAAVCTDCHGAHAIEKGTDPTSPMFWQNIPKTCGACHQEIAETFAASVHGRAVAAGQRDAPVCTDCHGEHTIAGIKEDSSTVSSAHIPETCGQCHSSQRISTRYTLASGVLDTYMQSFHGLASQIGGVAAANCASCHGYHGILPSTDPASSIHRQNLPETCGKCHAGIGTRLAQGDLRIHEPPGPGPGKAPIVNIVSNVYIAMIVIVIGGMFLFNLLDGAHKLRAHIRRVRKDPRSELRMTPVMRAQHGLLIITFVLLAYTGFVHKYPDAAWSWPFQVIENGTYWRGLIHRVAGWVFTGVFAAHLMMLLGTARGRSYLPHLWLRGHDAADALNLLRRNLGLGGPGPRPRQYNFAEKSEYWALVWGSFLMIISGVMLIFTSATLRLLPQVWLEVAQVVHYYEAILATLAIVIWHFYWVIFDPAEYPMNTAWLIGRKKPSHPHHEKLPTSDGESPK
jgi:cytochrome b subunit of formate dehydrogenase